MGKRADALVAERMQALMEEAFQAASGVDPDDEAILAWRSERGGKLVRDGLSEYRFQPFPGLRLPAGYDHKVLRYAPAEDVLRRAAALDRVCICVAAESVWGVCDKEALAIKRVVQTAYTSSKKRAAKTGVQHTLTLAELEEILWAQGLRCSVSGIRFSADAAGEDGYRAPFRPSLDRIVNSKGYVSGNVRLVLTLVNLAMNDWGAGPLIEVARAIAAKHPPPPSPLVERK